MKSRLINIISLILLFTALNDASLNKEKTPVLSNSYFPANNTTVLIYESSFGECITTYTQNGELTISSSEADDFEYRQSLSIKEDGIYKIFIRSYNDYGYNESNSIEVGI